MLEAIAELGTEAAGLKAEIIGIIEKSRDMWLRYQALLTLRELDGEGEDFQKMAQKLKDDPQELVRMEARYYCR
ncbi:MAG TPA: hypothetical protein VKY40_11050 [Halanaerobiales bacterium]|nr:hypothetical protein [Halanaerobiales bacterium]